MLEIKNVTFSYDIKPVINDMSFTIFKGQNVAVIGESGCGKSTLLKLVYGLYDLNEGKIFYNKKEILGPKFNLIPGEDYIKYLAQDFDLMPFITVEENVGKFLSNVNKKNKKTRILELLELVEMTEFATIKAKYLSGGQQQRIALARVLALEPEVLLLDEPFSQIDSFRKNSLRRNIFNYLKEKKITCIIATHDSTDALSFSDQTIVMRNGRLLAKKASIELFSNPPDKYTASLFGEVNEIKTELLFSKYDNGEVMLVYSHQLAICDYSNLKVQVKQNYFRGSHYLIQGFCDEVPIYFEHFVFLQPNSYVYLQLK